MCVCVCVGGGLPPVLEATEVPVPQATQSDALKARFAENHLPKARPVRHKNADDARVNGWVH